MSEQAGWQSIREQMRMTAAEPANGKQTLTPGEREPIQIRYSRGQQLFTMLLAAGLVGVVLAGVHLTNKTRQADNVAAVKIASSERLVPPGIPAARPARTP